MQFLVIAYDYKDGSEKRLQIRPQHLDYLSDLIVRKKCLYAARLEDDNKKPICSVMIFEYPSREELDQVVAEEPYTKNKVWEKIEVVNCVTADLFAKK